MKALTKTDFNFPGQKSVYHGKVRDVYNINGEKLVMVATDRISAFDVVLPEGIPYKGQMLNQIAAKFLDATTDICPNWKMATPDPMVTVGVLCEGFPVEMIVRGYLCGSAWRTYKSGVREICGVKLPDGMRENEKFPEPIVTPTTKAEMGLHDEDISKEEILKQGLATPEEYETLEKYTLALFKRGTEIAAERGLILVDTKYEFGKHNGTIYLMDEIHTPDSSRYFYSDGYQERFEKGEPQKQLSKEFVREWLMENGFQGKDGQKVPEMTPAIVQSISDRYIELFENITGEKFVKEDTSNSGFKGDSRIQEEKEGRDQRLQLFLFGEKDKQAPRADGDGTMPEFGEPALFELQEVRDLTGYRIRKCLTYKKDQIISGSDQSTTGCIIYRGVEAYLNYLEAYYLRNGKVDGKAAQYWTAIRKRGGVDTDYEKTIRNTDMSKEVDWAKYSGSTLVDATLFNIRRERRCEFIGEGMRWDDLMRWRAMDQLLTTKYIPEGFNFWDEAYDDYVAMKNDKGEPKYKIVSDGSSTANMSAKELGKYVRPYSIVKANNAVFDGYTFAKAYYLYPVPIRQMELLSPDRSVNNSVLYQNPYWPSKTSEPAIE